MSQGESVGEREEGNGRDERGEPISLALLQVIFLINLIFRVFFFIYSENYALVLFIYIFPLWYDFVLLVCLFSSVYLSSFSFFCLCCEIDTSLVT